MKTDEVFVERAAMVFQDNLMNLRETGDETYRTAMRMCIKRMDDYGKSDKQCRRLATVMRADMRDYYKDLSPQVTA